MEEKQSTTLEKDTLTGNIIQNLSVEDLIKSPTNDNNMLATYNVPDIAEKMIIGDVNKGKVKVLSIPSDKTGVGKYRSIDPHKMLYKLFKDDFFVEINPEPNYEDLSYFKNFDIIHIHKSPSNDYQNGVKIIKSLQKIGCKVIVDTDDYWKVSSFHPNYQSMLKLGLHERLLEILKVADWVSTTTPIFADEIRKFNKNVVVLPNAIDPEEPQFQPKEVDTDKIRIGFLGGSSHLEDIQLIGGLTNRLLPFKEKVQLVLVGFDLRGNIVTTNAEGKMETRAMKPEETVWYEYEQIFTSHWSILKDQPKYIKHLENFKEVEYEGEEELPYRRLWTKDINNYAKNYNNFDISLAPLVEDKFNSFKSQLKAVEAGFHKKALIAQDFGPYQIDLINLFDGDKINPKGNAILVDSRKNHKQWFQYVKRLINQPELIDLLGNNLYELANEKFNLRKVTKDRAEFYKSIL